jgi:hypothetical protein
LRVYIQTRQYSQDLVREIQTREMAGSRSYSTDKKLDVPRERWIKCKWDPNNSVHGGKLYLRREITGSPGYEDFGQLSDKDVKLGRKKPHWYSIMMSVQDGIARHQADHCFTEKRKDDWRHFYMYYPLRGLASLPAYYKPPFRLPVFSRSGAGHEPNKEITHLLGSIGEDESGRFRLFYTNGKDSANYEWLLPSVTYNGRLLDGTRPGQKPSKYGKHE